MLGLRVEAGPEHRWRRVCQRDKCQGRWPEDRALEIKHTVLETFGDGSRCVYMLQRWEVMMGNVARQHKMMRWVNCQVKGGMLLERIKGNGEK